MAEDIPAYLARAFPEAIYGPLRWVRQSGGWLAKQTGRSWKSVIQFTTPQRKRGKQPRRRIYPDRE